MRLQNQVIIVTGAGRGIGRAISEALAAEGARVALVSRTAAQLEEVAAGIRAAGGVALPVPADVCDAEATRAMVAAAERELGPVDTLLNNAGSLYAIGPVWEVDAEAWWTDVTINLQGVFLCCQAALPGMLKRGRGRIVNMIGGGTGNAFPYASGYAASKAAVMRLTECLAMETREHSIPVLAMGPGLVRTTLTQFQVDSPEGQKWLPRIQQAFDEGRDVPPTLAASLAVEICAGRLDRFTGRCFSAGEDLETVEAQAEAILAEDLRTLRMR